MFYKNMFYKNYQHCYTATATTEESKHAHNKSEQWDRAVLKGGFGRCENIKVLIFLRRLLYVFEYYNI